MTQARDVCHRENADLLQLRDQNAEQFFQNYGFIGKCKTDMLPFYALLYIITCISRDTGCNHVRLNLKWLNHTRHISCREIFYLPYVRCSSRFPSGKTDLQIHRFSEIKTKYSIPKWYLSRTITVSSYQLMQCLY